MILTTKTIQEIKLHDHTCLLFKNQLEFFHCAIPFMREGITNNEKCYIVIDEIKKEDVYKNFKNVFREGLIPQEEFTNQGNIVIEQFKNIYLKDGIFDINKTIETYVSILNKALSDGYSGLRVFAEISSSLQKAINPEEFYLYECKVDKCFKDNNFIAVCAYDKKYFSEEYLKKSVNIHPVEIDLFSTRL